MIGLLRHKPGAVRHTHTSRYFSESRTRLSQTLLYNVHCDVLNHFLSLTDFVLFLQYKFNDLLLNENGRQEIWRKHCAGAARIFISIYSLTLNYELHLIKQPQCVNVTLGTILILCQLIFGLFQTHYVIINTVLKAKITIF